MSNRIHLASLSTLALAGIAFGQSTIVVPTTVATAEGNSSTAYPWNWTSPVRAQYFYDDSNFTANNINYLIQITRLRFRMNGNATCAGRTYTNVTVQMSTCPVDHLAVTNQFAANRGLDLATVHTGPATVIAVATGTTPGAFYVDIPLPVPFRYDPTLGDLMVELDHSGAYTGGTSAAMDLISATSGVLGSRVWHSSSQTATTALSTQPNITTPIELTYSPAAGLYPSFTATPTRGPSPLLVQFTDTTYTSDPGGVLSWQWDLDGDSVVDSTVQNPSFTYTGCGSYSVSLTAVDGQHGPRTFTQPNFIVTDELTPGFTLALLAPPAIYQFTDATAPPAQTWAWDFNGDSVIDSTLQNPVWVYNSTCASNTVTLTVTRNCRTATLTRPILVAPASLTAVPFTGGNGTTSTTVVGSMFDLSVTAPDGISVCAITQGIYTYTGPFQADIYITPDTYLGKDANASAWRLVASGTGVSAGGAQTAPSRNDVLLNSPFYLPAGSYGIVVYLSALPSGTIYVSYSNGPLGPFGNADLTLYPSPATAPGVGKYDLFGTGGNTSRVWNGTFHYTTTSRTGTGGHGFFGAGCAGTSGLSTLSAAAAPRLGQTLAVTANRLPLNAAIGLLGFSRTNSVFGPLPLDLSPLGAPGCFARVSPDAKVVVIGASNTATWSLPVPSLPTLLGVRAFQQLLVLDAAANALGAVVSDAAGFVIGL